jgi:peptidoglycan/LPS O-acetylase OafA/YrhL
LDEKNVSKIINPYIEILRMTGIFLLVFYHIGCMGNGQNTLERALFWISGKGWIGTDLFLVIAGYYFHESFIKKYEMNLYSYWKNRSLRIIPGYYLFLIVYLTLGIPVENLFGNHFIMPKGYWLYFFTFTANIPMALGTWSGIALEGLFGISLLVQLFLLFSLLFVIIRKKKHRFLLLIILEASIFLIRFIPAIRDWVWFSYFFTFTRMDGFLAGVLLALLRDSQKSRNFLQKYRGSLLLVSLSALLATAPFSGWWEATHPAASIIVIPALGLFFALILNFSLSQPLPQWAFYTGDFVYSIYLAKLPLIYIVYGYFFHINMSLNKPYIFILMAFLICLLWGILFDRIHRIRKTITLPETE